MAYSDFTLEMIEEKFGINNQKVSLFKNVSYQPISQKLTDDLEEAKQVSVRTEKAKSEWIVLPVLRELRRKNNGYVTIFSGENLNADSKTGLKGECDFIIAKDVQTYSISYPILQVVEAKKNDVDLGIPQCMAQLLGAKIYNEKKGTPLSKIYGCVTTGDEWLFMVLENNVVLIDNRTYYLSEIEQVLGAFQNIIDYYKKELK